MRLVIGELQRYILTCFTTCTVCTGSTLDMSFKLLHEAQTKLKTIIHNKFDAAVRAGDVASVERFFKTFPLIGEKDSGLAKFSKYLCSQVRHGRMLIS